MIWILALAEFVVAAALVFRWGHWWHAWFFALGSGSLLLFALYARAPMWIGAVLGSGIAGLMLLTSRNGPRNSPQN